MKYKNPIVFILCMLGFNNLHAGNPVVPKQFINHKDWNFVENKGQLNTPDIKYYGHQGGVYLYCKPGMIEFVFTKSEKESDQISEATSRPSGPNSPLKRGPGGFSSERETQRERKITSCKANLILLNSNPSAQIIASDQQEYYENYYTANTPEQGITNVRTYKTITYKNIYPHIDMVLHSREEGMKYEFVVYPGGKVSDIQMEWEGIEGIIRRDAFGKKLSQSDPLGKDSKIEYDLAFGNMTESAPYTYQGMPNVRAGLAPAQSEKIFDETFGRLGTRKGSPYDENAETKIESQFTINKNNIIGFKTATYDKTKPLVIDPTLVWGTYFGGNVETFGSGVTVDKSGNVYIIGSTESTSGIATSGAFLTSMPDTEYSAFVAKFNNIGKIQWATYFGYSDEFGDGITTDISGNVFITGLTGSSTGIATTGAYQTSIASNFASDAFLAKFSDNGKRIWSTYFGGDSAEFGSGVATDIDGNVYITGSTTSTSGIATKGAYQTVYGGDYDQAFGDAFIAKFNTNGAIQWATYFGGKYDELGTAISTDKSENVYIVGFTQSDSGIATEGAFETSLALNTDDGFVAKFNASGGIQWATYYGQGSEIVNGISNDTFGNFYITGQTVSSSGIATSGSYQTAYGGDEDAFLTKFTDSGTLQWATYIGGNDMDEGYGVSADNYGNVYVTGFALSTNGIATSGAYLTYINGGCYEFVAKFDGSGDIQWSTYYAGTGVIGPSDIASDNRGNAFVTGSTNNTVGVATSGAYQTTFVDPSSNIVAFLAKFGNIIANDAGISSILNPKNYFCPDSQAVSVQLHNYGTSNLDSVAIYLSSNGKPVTVYHWKGNLLPDSSVSVPIGRFLFPIGKDTLKSWTSNPNGVADSVPENDTSTSVVTVLALPSVPISPDKSICTNSTDTIGTTAVVSNLYSWTSKPSGFHSSLPQVVVGPTTKTTYYVTVTSKVSGCSNSDSVTISLIPLPVVNTGPAETICQDSGTSIGATLVNSDNYSWTSDPAGFSSTFPKPYIAPRKTTTYHLTVTDNATGCSNSDSIIITVNPAPIVNAGSNATICAGSSVVIGDTESKNYTYTWISIPYGFSSTIKEPTVSPVKNITYYLYATNPKTGCIGFNTVSITVNPLPVPGIDSTHYNICTGTHIAIGINSQPDIAYSWTSQPPGFTSTQSNPIVNPAGNTVYFLTETNTSTGCSSNDSSKVTVTIPKAPVSSPGFNQTICYGNIAVLGADPLAGLTYSWTSDPPGFKSTSPKAVLKPDTTTTYYLTVKNNIGCTDLGAVTVKVNPLPKANAGDTTYICGGTGTTVQLGDSATSYYVYSWTSIPPGFTSSQSAPFVSPDTTTAYYLRVTDTLTGCSGYDSVLVAATIKPNVVMGVHYLDGFEYQFIAINPNYPSWDYYWDFGDTSNKATDAAQGYQATHVFTKNGKYTVTLYVTGPPVCYITDTFTIDLNWQFSFNIFPNPFGLQTDIKYLLFNPGHVRISLVDELGKQLGVLMDKQLDRGEYNTYFDATLWHTRPAMYFILFQLDDKLIVKKMIQIDGSY